MFRTSNPTLMHSLTVSKVCLVAEGVNVGLVGVTEGVTVSVGVSVNVAVKGSGVIDAVGDAARVGVGVTVGVGGGLFLGMKIRARRMINPINVGIPYLK